LTDARQTNLQLHCEDKLSVPGRTEWDGRLFLAALLRTAQTTARGGICQRNGICRQ
jgi:hypothetical protein